VLIRRPSQSFQFIGLFLSRVLSMNAEEFFGLVDIRCNLFG